MRALSSFPICEEVALIRSVEPEAVDAGRCL